MNPPLSLTILILIENKSSSRFFFCNDYLGSIKLYRYEKSWAMKYPNQLELIFEFQKERKWYFLNFERQKGYRAGLGIFKTLRNDVLADYFQI